ncbi:MAG: four helix bundle protein [Candidatus Levybacteria bacterium]|nr:four helix bundle protein [Candidatus Levybacteria bacterium]
MFKESLISKKAYAFGLEIIRLTKLLPKTYENIVLIKQIIRSATSIGANIEEALGSNSKKEFIHSMNVAKKEARETIYWLRLISDVNPRLKDRIETLIAENDEIIRILTKIVKTSSL